MNYSTATGPRRQPPERYGYVQAGKQKGSRSLRIRYNKLRLENKRLKEKLARQSAAAEAKIAEAVAEAISSQAASPDTSRTRTTRRVKPTKKFILFCLATVLIIGAFGAVLIYALDTGLAVPAEGVHPVVVLQGTGVAPDAFIAPIEDMAGVIAEFDSQIDFTLPGRHDVVLFLQDGRRRGTVRTALYVLAPAEYVPIEAGTFPDFVNPIDFIQNPGIVSTGVSFDVQIVEQLTDYCLRQVGLRNITLFFESTTAYSSTGAVFTSAIRVTDTTPPTATPVNLVVPMGYKVTPNCFVANVFDISPIVFIEFAIEPYMFVPGEQTVEVILEDYFGNRAVYTANLTILPNLVPPRLYGVQDILVQQGSPIMFRRGISAYDAFGRSIQFTVDSSGVDVDTLGVHTVIYQAVDAWGLAVEAAANVYVLEVDPDRVRGLADTVLEGILRDGMTQVEQARAIFDWIGNNIAYSAHIRRPTLYENAYQGLRNRQGNCFVFYSLSEVMLTQAGIPNMQISRYGGTSRHTWNLINPDNMGWHHFDTTPLVATVSHRVNRFMFTSSQAQAFTDIIAQEIFTPNYFTYDPDLYPEIVQ